MTVASFATLCRLLAAHGPLLLAGATALLMLGSLALLLHRAPAHRQRLGELTVGLVLLWAALACVPLPRWNVPFAADEAPQVLPKTLPPLAALPAYDGPPLVIDNDLIRAIAGDTSKDTGAPLPRFDAPAPAPLPRTELVATGETAGSPTVPLLSALYLSGALASLAWIALGRLLLVRLTRAAAAPEPWLARLFGALVVDESGSSRRAPRLLVSSAPIRPFSCGLIRPTIVLPADCARPANAAQVRNVLLHELGHVRRRDALGNALLNLALPVLWFHPLYWWLRSHVGLARELVADEWAAARTDRRAYVADLVALARSRTTAISLPRLRVGPLAAGTLGAIGVFGMFRSATDFYRRMHMLIDRRHALATRCSAGWRLACGCCAAAVLSLATGFLGAPRADAADDDESPPPATVQEAQAKPETPDDATATTKAESGENLIDSYVARALSKIGLKPSPEAEARTEWRRRFLDATGRVPDEEEAKSFARRYAALSAYARLEDPEPADDDGEAKADTKREAKEQPGKDGAKDKEKPADGPKQPGGRRGRAMSDALRNSRQTTPTAQQPGDAAAAADLARQRDTLQEQLVVTQRRLAELEARLAQQQSGVERELGIAGRANRTIERRNQLQHAQAMQQGQAAQQGQAVQQGQAQADQARGAEQAAQQAQRQAQVEFQRAQASVAQAQQEANRARQEAERALAEAQRAKQEAMAEAQRARQEAQTEAQRAQAEAQRARDEAQAEAARAKAEAEQAAKQQRDEAAAERDRAERAARDAREQMDRRRAEARESAARTGATAADPFANRGAAGGGSTITVGRGELDLVNLANSYSDAAAAVRVAEARYQQAETQAKEKGASAGELAVERASLDGARAKAELLRTVAQIALEGARSEYEMAAQQVKNGLAPASHAVEAEAKVKILQRILDSSKGDGGEERSGDRVRRGR